MSNTNGPVGQPERLEFLMTLEEFEQFKEACNPRIVLVGSTEEMMKAHAQQRARMFWHALGEKYGFDPRTAETVHGKHLGWFSAVVIRLDDEEAGDAN